jgi:phage baseplate assembly protein W
MAIEIYIDPLDLEFDTAIGIDLPMNLPTGAGFRLNYFSIEQALANAKNLLLTDKGERVMLPEFGCDIKKSLFENITRDLVSKMENQIRSAFAYWLPYIFITNLVITPNEDRNAVRIELTISLDINRFDTRSITVVVTNDGQ